MITKLLFISLLLSVKAQSRLRTVPRACGIPKSPPTCMYSTATPYFKSCGIYNGGNCPRFCHALQAQYWARQRIRRRCFRVTPSLVMLKRIYSFCIFRCAYAKRRIRKYRIDGLKNIGANASQLGWKASNIKALIYLSVNRRGFVTSRVLVYTTNPEIGCPTSSKGIRNCFRRPFRVFNRCICSTCWRYRATCPRCCRSAGHIWL